MSFYLVIILHINDNVIFLLKSHSLRAAMKKLFSILRLPINRGAFRCCRGSLLVVFLITLFPALLKAQASGFIPNKGQVYDQQGTANRGVKYLLREGGFQLQLRQTGFSYELFRKQTGVEKTETITRLDLSFRYFNSVQDMAFTWEGANETGEILNYYNHLGGFENIRRVRRVVGTSSDKNIRLVFDVLDSGNLKYDIWVKPEVADKLRLRGQEDAVISSSTDFRRVSFCFYGDTITENLPEVFVKMTDGRSLPVDGGWQEAEDSRTLSLKMPAELKQSGVDWLVVDPALILRWATYFGGSGSDYGYGVAAAPDGDGYFCGSASSSSLATTGAYKTTVAGSDDAFITKVSRAGGTNSKLYATYFGGTLQDVAYDIKCPKKGGVIVTGFTLSKWLGKKANHDSSYSDKKDAFLTYFNDSGRLEWFNYIGGTGDDIGYGINVDSSGNILFIGYTESDNISKRKSGSSFSIYDASYNNNGDALVGKFSNTGECLFLTYYGGTSAETGYSICSGLKDTIYFAGKTTSNTGIATRNSFVKGTEAFIVKFNPLGQRISSRYFGDSADDICYSIDYYKPDIFITGETNSKNNIATSRAFRRTLNFPGPSSLTTTDAFLTKLTTNLDVTWSTYYGGANIDDARSMIVDDFGYVYIVGSTQSRNREYSRDSIVSTRGAFQVAKNGGTDAYVAKFSSTGARIWGTYFGNLENDYGYDLAHGKFGDVYFVGETNSDQNLVKNAFQSTMGSAPDAFFADILYCKKFAIIRKDTVCLNDSLSIRFTDSSNQANWNRRFTKNRFEWTGPNNFRSNQQTAKRRSLWRDTGWYQLIVADSFGCRDTARVRINYFYPLPVDTILSKTSYCQWDTLKFRATAGPWQKNRYQYFWRSLDSVFRSGNKSDTLRYPALKGRSDGKYILRIRDHFGCTTRDTFNVVVGPVVQITSNSPVCPKDTMVLKATGQKIRKVIWKGPNGFADSGVTVLRFNASKNMAGRYTAYVQDSSGCRDTININVALFQLDSLRISRNDPVCLNQTLRISASLGSLTGKFSFKWTGPNRFTSNNASFTIANATLANKGTYLLQITETSSGCTIDTNINVDILTLPYPCVQTNAPVCEGGTFTIRSYPAGGAGSGYRFSWVTPRNVTRTDTGLTFKPVIRADSGLYRLRVTDGKGCFKDTSVVFSLKMLPDVNFTTPRDSQCAKNNSFTLSNTTVLTSGSFKNFNWKTDGFRDTQLTNRNAITRRFAGPGKYKVTLVATSNDGCIDSLTKFLGVYHDPVLVWKINTKDSQCLRGNRFEFDDQSSISQGTLSRTWTFGDGRSSTADPASNIYSRAGNFNVKLRVVSNRGCSDSSIKTVRVNANPVALISVNKATQCFNGHAFSLNDLSTISSGWRLRGRLWNLGSGYSDTGKTAVKTFNSHGVYTVLMASYSVDGCADTAKTTLTVHPSPKTGFRMNTRDSQCLKGNLFTFDDTSRIASGASFTRLWLPGNGTNSTSDPVNVRYTSAGKYTVQLKSISDRGCRDSVFREVVVHPQSRVSFSFQTARSQCLKGNFFVFKNGSTISSGTIKTYQWNLGNGRTPSNSDTVQAVYANYGAYPVRLFTISDYGCRDTLVDTAKVNATPVARFWVARKNQCVKNQYAFRDTSTIPAGRINSYKWHFGNGDSSSQRHPVYRYKAAGTYVVRFTVSSGIGCQNTYTDTMRVNPQARLAFGINTPAQCLRANQKFIFTDSSKVSGDSIRTYLWSLGDGRTSSRTDSVQHTYAAANKFQVSLFTETMNGCKDTLRKDVTVYPMPFVSYTVNNSSQCLRGNSFAFTDRTTLTSGSISSRLWSFGNAGRNTSTVTNPTFKYDTATAFVVKLMVTTAVGCKDSSSQTMNVRPMPRSIISHQTRDTQCFNGNVFRFADTSTIASGTVTRQWSFGDGVGSATIPRPSYTYKADGRFSVRLALNSNFNCRDTAFRLVWVSPKPKARIFINDSLQCLNGNRFSIIDTSTVKSPWKIDSSYFSFGGSQSSKNKRNSITYVAFGDYTIRLITQTVFGCRDTLNSKLTVYPMPRPIIGLLVRDSQCLKGNRFDFRDSSTVANGHSWKPLWNFGNRKTDTTGNSSPAQRYADTGKYVVTLRIRTNVGCIDSVKKTVVVHPQTKVAFSFLTAKAQCLSGNRFVVENQSSVSKGTVSYIWDLGNGRRPTRSDSVHAVYTAYGTYPVKLFTTTNHGCKDTITDSARVNATPVARFWVANKRQCLKNAFGFRDTSTIAAGKISTQKWYFGTGDSSTSRHPTYRYKAAGSYVVRFVVSSGAGCANTFTDTIRVYPQAKLSFGINQDAQCLRANQKFIFTDTSRISGSSFRSYSWNLGDSRNSNRTDSVQHTYASAGNFRVTLVTETNDGCKDTLQKDVKVHPLPAVNFTINNQSQCLKANIFAFADKTTMASGVISSRLWSFGNKAKNTSAATNPSFTYDTAMAYQVKLVVTSGLGCKDSASQTVNVRPMPKSAVFNRTNDTQCLAGNIFRFTDTSSIVSGSYTRQWLFGDGVGTSSLQKPDYSYAADGTFTVRLALNSDHNCKDTGVKKVVVLPMPVAVIKVSSNSLCERQDTGVFTSGSTIKAGNIISRKWYFGDGNVAFGNVVKHVYKQAGTYTLSLVVTSSSGCKDSASVLINVRTLPALGISRSMPAYCVNDSMMIDLAVTGATAPITYSWTGPNAFRASTQDVVIDSVKLANQGTYVVKLKDFYGCKADTSIDIKINPLPTATAYSNSPVCTRGVLALRAGGGLTYDWFGPNNFRSAKQDHNLSPIDSGYLGNYTVWVTDTNQCRDDFTIKVDVKPGFRVQATSNSVVCSFDTLKLFANISSFVKSSYSFEWDSKSFFSTAQHPAIRNVDSSRDGTYRVVARSANGCVDTSFTTPVILRPPGLKLLARSPECVGQQGVLYNGHKSAISYVWTKPDGTTVTADTIRIKSLKLNDGGKYKLRITDSRGCRNVDSFVYVVNKLPVLSVTGDTQLCTGSTLKMSVTGAANYSWSGPNAFRSFAASITRLNAGMADSGMYTVIGRDANGCRDTAYHHVLITPSIPGLRIFGDSQVCLWETLNLSTLTNSKKYKYRWRTPNGEVYQTSQLKLPLNKYDYEGRYSVVVSDSANYCSDSTTDFVWVGPRPMSSKNNSPVCAGDTLKLFAYGNSRWTWRWSGPQAFSSTSTAPAIPYVTVNYTGNFTLIGQDTLGCTDTLTETVKINDCLALEMFSDSVRCKGDATGRAWVRAFGGSGSYQYRWLTSPVRFGDTLKNLKAGRYTVVVTDVINGFVRLDSIMVAEPAGHLAVTVSTTDSLVCRDSSTARLKADVTGGTRSYRYMWNNNSGLNSQVLSNVPAGRHSVIVTDARGCTDTAEVRVVNPPAWNFTISTANVRCAGENSGLASVTVSGGRPSYFYQWDTVTWTSKTKTTGTTYRSLKAGIYKVLVTDANKCQQWDTAIIVQPDSIKMAFTINDFIRCYGDTSGRITAAVSGGIPGYQYLWNFNRKYTARTAANLAAGWYKLRVTDSNRCEATDSILLSQPADLRTRVSQIDHLKCYEDNSGYAEVNVTGGTSPYYVKWNNGGYTAQGYSKNFMPAGDHWVYVRDFQGCYDTLKLSINQPDSISTFLKRRQNVLCHNGESAWAEFEFAGGTPPYRYKWENGDTTKRSVKLMADNYWVRTLDANGCSFSDTIQLAQPSELVVFAKKTDSVSCFGLSDGAVQVDAVGGVRPYGFWFYTGKDTVRGETLKGVPARRLPFQYDAYVQDANGCIDHVPVFIPQPARLDVVRRGQTELVCYGARTAAISVSPSGGNGGYTYSWNSMPRQFTPTATGLKAGTYVVTLKDYKGCTDFDTFSIRQPAKNPILTNTSEAFCLNRHVVLNAYMYEVDSVWWYNPAGKWLSSSYPVFTKLNSALSDAGVYTLLARDRQGCYDTARVNVVVHKLPVVQAWIQDKPPYCKSDSISLRAAGALSYAWFGPNNFSSNLQNPRINGLTYAMTGAYRVLGTDINACQSWDTVDLKVENNLSIRPDQQVCAGSDLVLSGFGAEKYRWAGPKGFKSTLQSPLLMDVDDTMSGTFTLFAIDRLGCTDTLKTNVLIYPRPVISPAADEPVCAGEPLQLYANGGGNYQYRWSGPLGYTSSGNNPRIMTTASAQTGKYKLYASYQADPANLCKDSSAVQAKVFPVPGSQFRLAPQANLYFTETQYELHDLSSGANTWSYYLNDAHLSDEPTASFIRNESGTLIIKQVVTSSNQSIYSNGYCMDSSEQVVVVENKPKIWLPTAFTPNNNNQNDAFYPITVNITEYRLRIYDRWGNKIFDELNGKWNGMDQSGRLYPLGVYAVYVTYRDITGFEGEAEVSLTLLR